LAQKVTSKVTYFVNNGVCDVLVQTPILQYCEYTSRPTTGIGATYHVGSKICNKLVVSSSGGLGEEDQSNLGQGPKACD
jgi:hypothetical protein